MTAWPTGDNEMAGRIRAFDWSATPLGSVEGWSPALRAVVDMLLAHDFPMVLLWGPELIQIYNDGYRQILDGRHPRGLGQPTFECWPETLDTAGPIVGRASAGETISLRDTLFRVSRTGDAEDAWFTVTYSPVMGDGRAAAGVLVTVFETTDTVLADRALRESEERQTFLLRLSDALRPLNDPIAIQTEAMRVLGMRMGVNRAFYGDADDDHDTLVIGPGYSHDTFPLEGQVRFSEFDLDMAAWYRAGRTYVIEDAQRDTRFGEKTKAGFDAIRVCAAVGVPLVKEGRVRAIVSLHQSEPRRWTAAEIALLEETAERTWAAVERARAEAKLRESEVRFRAFVTASSDVIYRMSPDWSEMRQLDGRGILTDTTDPLADWMAQYIHRGDQRMVDGVIRQAIRTRSLFELEHRVHRLDGSLGWTLSRAVPVLDETGEITEWLGSAKDITDRRRAQERLRESEERFRQFADASADALWIRDAATLAMEYTSPAIQAIYGIGPDAILGELGRWLGLITPEDRDSALTHLKQARDGEAVTHEFRIVRPSDAAQRWIRNTDFPLRDEEGRVVRIGGIAEDVTETRRLQDSQAVMVAELQHRTRNLIAVVRGVADDTMEHTGPTEAFRAAFFDRLAALSRVQSLLSRSEAEPITIAALVRLELDALGAEAAGERISVAGPDVFLRPSTVQTLAMTLHELATNARKYGALSHGRGRLAVTWRERVEDGEHRLALDWVETGLEQAPERAASARVDGGYGRELIENALPHVTGARTSYALTVSGVRCTIDIAVRTRRGDADHDHG